MGCSKAGGDLCREQVKQLDIFIYIYIYILKGKRYKLSWTTCDTAMHFEFCALKILYTSRDVLALVCIAPGRHVPFINFCAPPRLTEVIRHAPTHPKPSDGLIVAGTSSRLSLSSIPGTCQCSLMRSYSDMSALTRLSLIWSALPRILKTMLVVGPPGEEPESSKALQASLALMTMSCGRTTVQCSATFIARDELTVHLSNGQRLRSAEQLSVRGEFPRRPIHCAVACT